MRLIDTVDGHSRASNAALCRLRTPRRVWLRFRRGVRSAGDASEEEAADKPLPDPEQFLIRDVLEKTLKDMNYVPTKLDPAAH